jgi:hypothetical protein
MTLPVTIGAVRYPGIKIHESRIIRLLRSCSTPQLRSEVGRPSRSTRPSSPFSASLTKPIDSTNSVTISRKLKGHGLLQRDGSHYSYRLTTKGIHIALLFLFFHKRFCGPLANSRFHHQPHPSHQPNSKLEAAYHKADKAIERIVDLLKAA